MTALSTQRRSHLPDLRADLAQLLRSSRLDALLEGRDWDVVDAIDAIWPTVRDAAQPRSLMRYGA